LSLNKHVVHIVDLWSEKQMRPLKLQKEVDRALILTV